MAPFLILCRHISLLGLVWLTVSAAAAATLADAAERAEVIQFARLSIERAMARGKGVGWEPGQGSTSRLGAASPVFLTLVLDGKTRACQGSLEPTALNLAMEIEATARRIAAGDRRHPPLLPFEVERGHLVISIPGPRMPLPSGGVDPRRFGLVVETDAGGSGVLLPGEARTFAWMLREARRRAGALDKTAWRAWVFPTEVLGEAALPGLEPEPEERRRR